MQTIEKLTTILSKQRLRNELNSHIEDFLHNGGKIEVLARPATSYAGKWAAASDFDNLPGADSELS